MAGRALTLFVAIDIVITSKKGGQSAAMIPWDKVFTQDGLPWKNAFAFDDAVALRTIDSLRRFLDAVHIRLCLVRPFQEMDRYPLVEARELLPSFDADLWEYDNVPGFAMVALGRPLEYFSEIFQFDILHPAYTASVTAQGASCPLEGPVIDRNVQSIAARLPRVLHESFRQRFGRVDTSAVEQYPALMPFLVQLDRAHVMALDDFGQFHLAGIFASFPSDIDNELKRFGMRIGKFSYGDNAMYERNRLFVYQYLMELYGFPIVSERRTSSALFARKLHKMGERFHLRVLGQSDRVITSFTGDGSNCRYPLVEKTALIAVDKDQEDALRAIENAGCFLDPKRRVVIIRVTYLQHVFDPDNVRQERAMSVVSQEILHPLTGRPLSGVNVIKDSSNMFLRLNDIVRGEYTGRTIYKRTEIVENTDTEEKRLKFLFTWLGKHQRRMIGYRDDFFANVSKVLTGYLNAPEKHAAFENHRELYRDVYSRFSYIQQARKVRILQDLQRRFFKNARIPYRAMLREAVALLQELKFEIVTFFPAIVDAILATTEAILADKYLVRTYIDVPEENLSGAGQEIRKNYRRVVALHDEILSVRKARTVA